MKSSAGARVLSIPTRLQWENGHGYCGETSIQACSLYYGSYISQNEVRKLAEGEVLLGENAEETIQKLGYEIEVWDNEQSKPQYKKYLQWIKKMIGQGYPVITCGYDAESNNDEYDHIYLVVGVNSKNMEEYSDEDELVYMTLFSNDYTVTKFGEVWDTRAMNGNGKDLEFAIPRDVNYGVAIKGIKDPKEQFLPVHIDLEEKSEPNVSTGEQPKQFHITVTVEELEVGKRYALLKYESYKVLPSKSAVESQASSCERFTAEATTFSKEDVVMSSKSVFYRCVEEADLS